MERESTMIYKRKYGNIDDRQQFDIKFLKFSNFVTRLRLDADPDLLEVYRKNIRVAQEIKTQGLIEELDNQWLTERFCRSLSANR